MSESLQPRRTQKCSYGDDSGRCFNCTFSIIPSSRATHFTTSATSKEFGSLSSLLLRPENALHPSFSAARKMFTWHNRFIAFTESVNALEAAEKKSERCYVTPIKSVGSIKTRLLSLCSRPETNDFPPDDDCDEKSSSRRLTQPSFSLFFLHVFPRVASTISHRATTLATRFSFCASSTAKQLRCAIGKLAKKATCN